MRRFRQQLPPADCEAILQSGTSGVLSLVDGGGAPYGVPLSYLWAEGKVVFHCAAVGMKLDCIAHEPRVSFCVIGTDDVAPERYTTHYRSVIVRGKIHSVDDAAEKTRLALLLAEKYRPGFPADAMQEIADSLPRLCVLVLEPDEVTGKEARELMEKRGAHV